MIADELNKLKQTKAQIKQALIDKGQNPTDEFATYSDNIAAITSGGGTDPLAEIGWNISQQPYLKDAIDYAKEIQLNPKSTYQNDKQLVIFPKVDELKLQNSMFYNSNLTFFPDGVKLTGTLYYAFQETPIQYLDLTKLEQVASLDYAFLYCRNLQEILTNENFGVGVTRMINLFSNCISLKSPITLNISSCISMANIFYMCESIPSITLVGDPSNITDTQDIFKDCDSLTYLSVPEDFPLTGGAYGYGHLQGVKVPKIYGSFDYSKCQCNGSSSHYWVCGFDANPYTRYMVIKNLGYYQSGSYLNMEYSRVWGIANDEVPDARQSLIDSLVTYSFDRASAGYSTMTMKLYADVKALLTEEEIAQITAKGYTIA